MISQGGSLGVGMCMCVCGGEGRGGLGWSNGGLGGGGGRETPRLTRLPSIATVLLKETNILLIGPSTKRTLYRPGI
jgi:hypothetical protein